MDGTNGGLKSLIFSTVFYGTFEVPFEFDSKPNLLFYEVVMEGMVIVFFIILFHHLPSLGELTK